MTRNRLFTVTAMLTLVFLATAARAAEVGFIEDFSLAEDREQALKQLIPGTDDHFYFHALHYQNSKQYDKVTETLNEWRKQYPNGNYPARYWELADRQALLTYDRDPKGSLNHIRARLNLYFNHQRETLNEKPNLPTALDQNLISRERLTQVARARHGGVAGFEERALDWVIDLNLNPDERRQLLQRLERPDHDNLPQLIVADLKYKYSAGFGSFNIHRQLLLEQLEACVKLYPELLNHTNFVTTYLTKLRPNPDVDWRNNPVAYEAYLDRLWDFASRLNPAHNSLKAHVLYHRLVFDRAQGVWDKQRFMAYVQLPKHMPYVNNDWMRSDHNRKYAANLHASYEQQTLLPAVGNDEPLVQSYLHQFFITADTWNQYDTWIRDTYLKHHFAETKIVNGIGDERKWFAMLSPAYYQTLKERIDLDFAYTNQEQFDIDEPVSVDLFVKNVNTLLVKVYEINANNYYRENWSEVDTDINLDGLVANWEKTFTYENSPFLRERRHFEFPQIAERGVYVIDFIGNGKSSRVLVRKGKLHYLARTSVAGHVFTVLNEKNEPLKDAGLWLAGHDYKADEDGLITVPFTSQPARQPIVLTHDGFASFDYFHHEAENYNLTAGIHVDRGALIARKKANVLVRAQLELNGTPVTLNVLNDVRLVISSVDHDGVQSSKEVSGFELFEDRDAVYEFTVPQRLSTISFTLKAKVKNLSQGKEVDLASQGSFTINQIDKTDKTADLHFMDTGGLHVVELLGRTGEARADKPVNFVFKHRDFKDPVHVTLQTDQRGRVMLGALEGVDWVQATSPQNVTKKWDLRRDNHTYHRTVHGRAGEPVWIPFMGDVDAAGRSDLSLLQINDGTFVEDRFNAAKVVNGFVRIDDLPRGDYDLLLKGLGQRIQIRLAEGKPQAGWVLGDYRYLEKRNPTPLQIESVDADDEALTVKLANTSQFSRVHVFVTRYRPAWSSYDTLRVGDPEPYHMLISAARSAYVAGRSIGDEYRYILERKYAEKYPGNMLDRPGVLLNPWAIRHTETGEQMAHGGDQFGGKGGSRSSQSGRDGTFSQGLNTATDFANLDFLGQTSAVLLNLTADPNGVVKIERKALGDFQDVHVVAVDPRNTAFRSVSLVEPEFQFVDLRLRNGLEPDKHYSEQKQISIVRAGDKFTIGDITTSSFEAYDSLTRVYSLYATLTNDPKLIEFSFILDWPNLSREQKQDKYSEYACHELNYFIYKKDRKFFDEVVKPYLAHKRDKTFMDRWLLGQVDKEMLEPWEYHRLNTPERILLARRIPGEMQYTSQDVTDRYQLNPPNLERLNHLFKTAIQGSALDAGDAFGFDKALDDALPSERFEAGRKMLEQQQGQRGGFGPGNNAAPKPTAPTSEAASGRPGAAPPPADAAADSADEMRRRDARSSAEGKAENEKADYAEANMNRLKDKQAKEYFERDAKRREFVRQYYRKLEKTQEWVENNYYKLPIEQQDGDLITVNAFWNDFAKHDPGTPFYSKHMAQATNNFPEMMFALSVLDLPFKPDDHKTEYEKSAMTLDAGSSMVVFHKEIKPADVQKDAPILVSQNFFRHGDRHRMVNGEQVDKYVDQEFLVDTVYGAQVVVTNPSSSTQKLDVLLQVPQGAIAVLGGQQTRGAHLHLGPFSTQAIEYYFYFPAAGKYEHYPVHVAKSESTIAFAEPFTFNVVNELSNVDKASWAWISQWGTEEQVLEYLREQNLHRVDLAKIAWRMQDESFFKKAIVILTRRHNYNHVLFSYGLKHNTQEVVTEFLEHADSFVRGCGTYLVSPLLVIDPVERRYFQFREYSPLVNARAHQLGKEREIVNERMAWQYHELLDVLKYKPELNDQDQLTVTYYMLLQDRVGEAFDFFAKVNPDQITTRLQYDEMRAYLDFYTEDLQVARGIVEMHKNHPVDRWRKTFLAMGKQLDEIQGGTVQVADDDDRNQQQTKLAATEPNFEFTVEAKRINISYQNLSEVQANYYLMDVELLFSRNPFVQSFGGAFSYIKPNATQTVKLNPEATQHSLPLPDEYHTQNVLVEVVGAGQRRSQAYYSNAMTVQVIDNYGQVRVTQAANARAIPKAYVKVYAMMSDGRVKFYKDGYTDLRGRFDYLSLNTDDLNQVVKFSLLVLSDEFGAVVREATPPKR